MRFTGLVVKRYYLNVVTGKDLRLIAGFLRAFLLPFSLVYASAIRLRNILFDLGFLKSYAPKTKLISVGNITWGGTAKTSLVLRLVEHFLPRGKVAVLSRGYSFDEPALIREWFSGRVEVFEGKDRAKMIKQIESAYPLVILDDAFQYRYLKPRVNILLFNAADPLPGRLIPAGIYRENVSSIRRADCALITAADMVGEARLSRLTAALRRFKKDLPVYYAAYRSTGFFKNDQTRVTPEQIAQKRTALISGIAFPEGLQKKVEEQGVVPQKVFVYPDHHRFTPKDIEQVNAQLRAEHIEYLVTTYKDFFRLRQFLFPAELVVMKVRLSIQNEDEFFKEIERRVVI